MFGAHGCTIEKQQALSIALCSRRTECHNVRTNSSLKIQIINLSALRHNHFRENHDALKNRKVFPPLLFCIVRFIVLNFNWFFMKNFFFFSKIFFVRSLIIPVLNVPVLNASLIDLKPL